MSTDPTAPAPRRRTRRKRSRLGLFLFLLLGSAVVGELMVRFAPFDAFSAERLVHDWDNTRYEPHPYLAYAPRKNWVEGDPETPRTVHNSHGFRGPEITREKPEGTFRVACLGGSSTYGHGPTSNATTWPQQLQGMLQQKLGDRPVEVLNAGTSGYSSFESLVNLSFRVLEYDPDVVLVYHSINDVRLWRWPDIEPDNTHFRAVWPVMRRSGLTRWLEKSRLFLFLRANFTSMADEDLGAWVIKDFGVKQALRWKVQPEGPVYFERNLKSILAQCRARGIDVMFAKQACFQGDLDNDADVGGMRLATQVLAKVAKQAQIPFVDVHAAVPQDRAHFTNDVHVTDAGAGRIAWAWAQGLVQHGMLPAD